MVGELGYSINAAAAAAGELGLAVGQAVRYLKKEGVGYKHRPRVLNSDNEPILRQMLESGEDREIIATTLGIRKAYIREHLARHVK